MCFYGDSKVFSNALKALRVAFVRKKVVIPLDGLVISIKKHGFLYKNKLFKALRAKRNVKYFFGRNCWLELSFMSIYSFFKNCEDKNSSS